MRLPGLLEKNQSLIFQMSLGTRLKSARHQLEMHVHFGCSENVMFTPGLLMRSYIHVLSDSQESGFSTAFVVSRESI